MELSVAKGILENPAIMLCVRPSIHHVIHILRCLLIPSRQRFLTFTCCVSYAKEYGDQGATAPPPQIYLVSQIKISATVM